jgi:hypothetical protein
LITPRDIIFSREREQDETSHSHNNKLHPEKENKKKQVTGTTTNCFQRKITRRIKSQAQQQTASRER